jgi:hypothetical protein
MVRLRGKAGVRVEAAGDVGAPASAVDVGPAGVTVAGHRLRRHSSTFGARVRFTSHLERLATAPGIGPIRAALLVAIVVTPARFRTTRQFWSYSGLGIVSRSSSDWVRDSRGVWVRKPTAQTRGLNRNRQPELKGVGSRQLSPHQGE